MPVSEARLDTPTDLVRVRFTAYTGDLHGVLFVDGEAQAGMARAKAQRMAGIFGHPFQIVGPWESTSAPTGPAPSAPAAVEAVEPAPLPVRPSKPARGR